MFLDLYVSCFLFMLTCSCFHIHVLLMSTSFLLVSHWSNPRTQHLKQNDIQNHDTDLITQDNALFFVDLN